ncbi:MAG: Eco29kI family restriction endonuclease [Planctomycetia bacterium]
MSQDAPFNPLDKKNLGVSVVDALLHKDVIPLESLEKFTGVGIYAIYYVGDFPSYKPVSDGNVNGKFDLPIYVGKAVPEGSRRGLDDDKRSGYGSELYGRLKNHVKSIAHAGNLNQDDFFFRYLIVDDIWIPLGETLLINKFRPVWNSVVDGFGNNDPGGGRKGQKKSAWDELHPGRGWAGSLTAHDKSVDELLRLIDEHFKRTQPQGNAEA